VAFSLDTPHRQWMAIKFSEFHGAEFDIGAMRFKERKP